MKVLFWKEAQSDSCSVPSTEDSTHLGQALKGILFEDSPSSRMEFETCFTKSLQGITTMSHEERLVQTGHRRDRSDFALEVDVWINVPIEDGDTSNPPTGRRYKPLFPNTAIYSTTSPQ